MAKGTVSYFLDQQRGVFYRTHQKIKVIHQKFLGKETLETSAQFMINIGYYNQE
jgi:hypothetical protein